MNLKDALDNLDFKCALVDDAQNEAELAQVVVGECIRKERRAKSISLRKFAERVKISPAYLSDIERGNRYPAYEVLERIKRQLPAPKSPSKII